MTELGCRISETTQPHAAALRVGLWRPSVLWHYFADNLWYTLVRHGIPSRAAGQVADTRAVFETHAAYGQFNEKWFDVNIEAWCLTFSKIFDRAQPVRILEIGSWEGRSTLFFLAYFMQGRLTAVDTWAGSDEHRCGFAAELEALEARFDANVATFGARLTKRKGSSSHVLPQLVDEQREFDIVYVDGSHFADDVLTDGINSWRLLRPGGVLIFDDFAWRFYPRARENPAWAISLFLKYHAGEYNILSVTHQVVLQKRIDIRRPRCLGRQFNGRQRGSELI